MSSPYLIALGASFTLIRLMATYPSFDAKDPDSTLDYVWDWHCWIGDDELASASFVVEPDNGLSIVSTSIDPETSRALVWLTGGTVEQNYLVTCRITTSGGRTDDRTVFIRVESR